MTPDFKFDKIIWNENNLKKIMNSAQSPQSAALLQKYGGIILNAARPQIATDMNKRYSKYTPLNKAFIITEPKLAKKTYKGEKFESYQLKIKPQKNRKYYYVVMSGSNTYNGAKRKINYSMPTAKAFPIENATRRYNPQLQADFISLVFKKAQETNDDN